MSTRHGLLLLGLLLGPVLSGSAHAQDDDDVAARKRRQSHAPIPRAVNDPHEAQLFLNERLHQAQKGAADRAELQRLLENPGLKQLAEQIIRDPSRFGVKPDQIKQLRERFQNGRGTPDLSDPDLRKLFGELLARQNGDASAGMTITAAQQAALDDLLKRLPPENQLVPGSDSGPSTATPGTLPGASRPQEPPPGDPGKQPPASERPSGPGEARPDAPPDAQARLSAELLKFAERLQKMDPALKNSPALKEFVRKMNRYTTSGKASLHLPESTKHLGEGLPRLGEYLRLDRLRPDTDVWRRAGSWFPQTPRFSSPPGNALRQMGLSTGLAPSPSRTGRDWQFLLWVLVALGFGILFWRLLAWNRQRVSRARAGGWKLGPWPVDPAAVASRADLVRAFDYLALLRLGPAVRAWNHLEIGAQFQEDARSSDRRQAAAFLAILYEQARYAPPTDALPDAELARARRALCLLARVSAA
jgi:hypothetical protein